MMMNSAAPTFDLWQKYAPGSVTCSHCGLNVPASLLTPGTSEQFCCNGCKAVFHAINASGLQDYYAFRQQGGQIGQQAKTSGKSYAEFDDIAFVQSYCRTQANGAMSAELFLEGVHCSACVWLVEHAAGTCGQTTTARLDVQRSTATVTWNPKETSLAAIAQRLDAIGYTAHAVRGNDADALRKREERALLARIGVAWAIAGNVMVMSLALYTGWFSDMDLETTQLFRWVSLALTIPSIAWCGQVFFRGAMRGLRAGILHMDLPIAIGLAAGFIGSTINTLRGTGEVYFDSVASLIFLLLIGRWLQQRQRRVASDATALLFNLAPSAARRVVDGEVREVAVVSLAVGDVVQVRAGDTIPIDGSVIQGQSSLDTSLLTGESLPVAVQIGAKVHAGTTNLTAQLHIKTTATGAQTRVGQLMQQVEEASRRRAPIAALADRVLPYFVAIVLSLAAITAAIWLLINPNLALDHTIALLVVTCPCALGLATPLALHAALGKAAQMGVLVKGGDAIERLSKQGLVLFDKTGTLTQGEMTLQRWRGDTSVQALVAAAEKQSSHPLAQALVRALAHLPALQVDSFVQTGGGGLAARVGGRDLLVGSPAFVANKLGGESTFADDCVAELTAAGLTPVLIAVDGAVCAAAGLGDALRPDAAQSIAQLQAMGMKIGILSGDHPTVVADVARQLGLDPGACVGAATPEAKLAYVREKLAQGPVFMVGDGVNDAAALAAATVGIGVHGGAEASLAAADVFLTRPGLHAIVSTLIGARRTVHVIRRNIAFSLFYNAIGIALAMSGHLNPLLAAILMPIGSLTVVSSSFRSRTFGGR